MWEKDAPGAMNAVVPHTVRVNFLDVFWTLLSPKSTNTQCPAPSNKQFSGFKSLCPIMQGRVSELRKTPNLRKINVPVDDAGRVKKVQREDDLAHVEPDFTLFEPSAIPLQDGEKLPAGLVVDHEEEVSRGLKAGCYHELFLFPGRLIKHPKRMERGQ
jgi:hypothetical protein